MIPLRDTIPSRHLPVMTWSIILVTLAVFLYQLKQLEFDPEAYQYLLGQFGLIPESFRGRLPVLDPAAWFPFVSYMFLHGGWMHAIGNLWALWLFGDNVEDRMGPGRFLLFYLTSGIVAGLVHFYSDPLSPSVTIGASGAIAGIMGAYFVMFPSARIVTLIPVFFIPLFLEIPALVYLGFWLLSQIYSFMLSREAGEVSNIAWTAHIGGFLAGLILHPLFLKTRRKYY
jgi:membrane associated rhomboid family serine protease